MVDRGRFIVLDGAEGCGKSTQAGMLRDRLAAAPAGGGLAGDAVLLVRDPGSTGIGEQIRRILLDPDQGEMGMRCEMLLYMAARAQMMARIILPALEAGKVVVCDRFVSSTLAYQLGGDGLSAAEIRTVAETAIRGRWPDLTILLDLPTHVSLERVRPKFTRTPDDPNAGPEKDRIERRPLAYHEQVRQNYLDQAHADPTHYQIINAAQPPAAVHAEIWQAVGERGRSRGNEKEKR